ARPSGRVGELATSGSATSVSVGSIGSFLAIGCPICNKVIVGLFGLSGALTIFAPIQPLIGAASVALLAAGLALRLRDRARACATCADMGSVAR
ncbi:MAG: hypothetical protein ABIZ34_04140, partial [Candidatus Limnocylindrales bacterium]